MKRFLHITVLLFSLCAGTTALAQQAVENTTDSRIIKRINPALVQKPVSLKGNLSYWVNANNEFVVYAETDKGKYMFLLQMDGQRKINPATGKFVEVTYLGNCMILNDGKKDYYFGIEPPQKSEVLQRAQLTQFDVVVEGTGLSRHQTKLTDKTISLDKLKGADSAVAAWTGEKK